MFCVSLCTNYTIPLISKFTALQFTAYCIGMFEVLNVCQVRNSSLRECLRTHKVFTKNECFNLNYHKFSMKSYVLDVYLNRLGEAILIHIHNI